MMTKTKQIPTEVIELIKLAVSGENETFLVPGVLKCDPSGFSVARNYSKSFIEVMKDLYGVEVYTEWHKPKAPQQTGESKEKHKGFPKAIPTEYKDELFRSKLEARWAVFFEEMAIQWEYEPEAFKCDGGLNYLPDFKITQPDGCEHYLEVKPKIEAINKYEWSKMTAFSDGLIILDGIPKHRLYFTVEQYVDKSYLDEDVFGVTFQRGKVWLDFREALDSAFLLGEGVEEACDVARRYDFAWGNKR